MVVTFLAALLDSLKRQSAVLMVTDATCNCALKVLLQGQAKYLVSPLNHHVAPGNIIRTTY